MVRGNWQQRVEKAEARKENAKQRKQRTEERRLCKVWFQDLLNQLDRYDETLQNRSSIHIWTDIAPSSTEHLVEILGDDEDGRIGKKRDKGRPRSDSIGKGKKKAHPRSRSGSIAEEPEVNQLLLCRSWFLKGADSSCLKGKKSGCRYIHYSPRFESLGSVLGDSFELNELETIEKGVIDSTSPDLLTNHPGAMDFLYHTTITFPTKTEDRISSIVTHKLAENDTPASSVYYVAFNGILLFDRLRGGVMLDERDYFSAVAGNKTPNRRTSSICSQGSDNEEEAVFRDLPTTVLEHILLFLPDDGIAAAAQVCKAWYNEIGQHSPNLWLSLLSRRSWPVPTNTDDEKDERSLYRFSYIEHYSILRDVKALSSAATAVTSRQAVNEVEVGCLNFSKLKHSPQFDRCVSFHIWSDKLVLAGYKRECSLRLFEASGSGDAGEIRCKELIYQNVSPYQNTKKRDCELTAVELDEHNIGCLCSVSSYQVTGKDADILVILGRDEFLLGQSSSAAAIGGGAGAVEPEDMKVIDIGESFLNFLFSSDVVDHRLLPLFDFLNDGGEIGDIAVKTSGRSLCACGFGRFLVELSVSIPDLLSEDGGMVLLDRKLVLFSSNFNAIVWAGDSYPSHLAAYNVNEEVTVALCRERTICSVASKAYGSPEIVVTEIDASGTVQPSRYIAASASVRPSIVQEGRSFEGTYSLVITRKDIISVEALYNRRDDGDLIGVQSYLVFFPRYPETHQADFDILRLPKDFLVKRIDTSGEQHLVVFCWVNHVAENEGQNEESVLDELDGQWFSPGTAGPPAAPRSVAVVVSVPSRCIVGMVDITTSVSSGWHEYKFSSFVGRDGGCTTGMAIDTYGIAITGSKVRSKVATLAAVGGPPSSSKKKKKAKVKRSGKKDGFARGMSLRG